jgi:hypothetical protein
VVIFPHIKELPLTALPDLTETLPNVYALLKDGREWTVEAEAEFLLRPAARFLKDQTPGLVRY